MRLKCPYCGARRSKNTVRKEREDITGAKFIVGGLILLVLIAAVVVLIVTSSRNRAKTDEPETPVGAEFTQDEGVNSVENENSTETSTDVTEEKVEITAVKILLNGEEQEEIELRMGESCELTYKTEPVESEDLAIWTSDDEAVAVVMQNGQVTATGEGTTAVNVKIGDKTDSVIIRVG
jgi:cytoskeletal protein RodZ